MTTTPATGLTAAETSPQSTSSSVSSVTQDEFLQLLVTQLRYQDPTEPIDSTQFTAQLAQFSTLEQMTTLNETMAAYAGMQLTTQSASLIGHQVEYVSSSGATVGGTVSAVSVSNAGLKLVVDGTEVDLASVVRIS